MKVRIYSANFGATQDFENVDEAIPLGQAGHVSRIKAIRDAKGARTRRVLHYNPNIVSVVLLESGPE